MQIDTHSGDRELKREAADQISYLDKKIQYYLEELVKMVLPSNSSKEQEDIVYRFLEPSVKISVYKRELEIVRDRLTHQKSFIYVEDLLSDRDIDETRNILSKVTLKNRLTGKIAPIPSEKQPKISDSQHVQNPFEAKRYHSPNPSSVTRTKHISKIYSYKVKEKLAFSEIKEFFKTYPHLKHVLDLKQFIENGGDLAKLPLDTKLYHMAVVHANALRSQLVDKTFFGLEPDMDKWLEYKGQEFYTPADERKKQYHFLLGMESLSNVITYAKLLDSKGMQQLTEGKEPSERDLEAATTLALQLNGYALRQEIDKSRSRLNPQNVGVSNQRLSLQSKLERQMQTDLTPMLEEGHRKKMRREIVPYQSYASDPQISDKTKAILCLSGLICTLAVSGYIQYAMDHYPPKLKPTPENYMEYVMRHPEEFNYGESTHKVARQAEKKEEKRDEKKDEIDEQLLENDKTLEVINRVWNDLQKEEESAKEEVRQTYFPKHVLFNEENIPQENSKNSYVPKHGKDSYVPRHGAKNKEETIDK